METPFREELLEWPWRKLIRFEVLDSTQLHASRMLARGCMMQGVVLQAERQHSGRGRLDHAWVSEPGGLYVTAGLPCDLALRAADTGWISLIAALACARVIREQTGLEAQMKWPNDLLIKGRKVGGLLGEVKAATMPAGHPAEGEDGKKERLILIGLGLNWLNPIQPAALAGGFTAAALGEFCDGLDLDGREIFLKAWMEQLNSWHNLLLHDYNQAVDCLKHASEAILWKKGERVCLQNTEKGAIEGLLLGLGTGGAAHLKLESGREVEVHCGWQSNAAGK